MQDNKTTDSRICSIETPCGNLTGLESDNIRVFRGIRYARADRWELPKAVKHWDGEYDATEFGACCYQHRAFDEDAVVNPFYHREFRVGDSFDYSEDCLFLNIWTPAVKPGEKLPVLFFIHGGSFTGGCGHESVMRGNALCSEDVVLVTINYRLGPYGFASHPDLSVDGICGNYGLYDQLEALRWVRRNIDAFGGDPEKICLMGQSAGAMSVTDLCISPLTLGLVKGAIMMSGAGVLHGAIRPRLPEETRGFWDAVCRAAGAEDMNALAWG